MRSLVLPTLRGNEDGYPAAYDAVPPLPLRDLAATGEYHDFRYRVWRSVLTYPDLLYDAFDAYRLVEIHFEKDAKYTSVRELIALDLLVLSLGLAELPNRFMGPLVVQVLTLRQQAGPPTWVHVPRGLDVQQAYTKELADLLRPALHTLDPLTAPPNTSRATLHPGRA